MSVTKLQDKLKRELIFIGIIFVIALIIFKIAFFKENLTNIFRLVLGFFWLFIIPGFYMMYQWHNQLAFIERVVIGIVVSAAIMGISSYYLGLFGLNIQYHGILLPSILLIIAVVIILRKIKSD